MFFTIIEIEQFKLILIIVTKISKYRGSGNISFSFFREFYTPLYEKKGVDIFMKIKFRNVDTGEIIEIDMFDSEAFDECMSHENYQLIFD